MAHFAGRVEAKKRDLYAIFAYFHKVPVRQPTTAFVIFAYRSPALSPPPRIDVFPLHQNEPMALNNNVTNLEKCCPRLVCKYWPYSPNAASKIACTRSVSVFSTDWQIGGRLHGEEHEQADAESSPEASGP